MSQGSNGGPDSRSEGRWRQGPPDGGPRGRDPRGAGNPPGGRPGPRGDTHAWYRRGLELLGQGNPAAAAQVLQHAAAAEPHSRSIREALARAQFDARRYAEAADNFRLIVEASPADDYAHFGLGLSLARTGDHASAAEYLALAAAMRPDSKPYTDALHAVRATLRARRRGAGGSGRAGRSDRACDDTGGGA